MATPTSATFTTAQSAGSATGAAPTLATDGLAVGQQAAIRVTVSADPGQTVTGTGKLLAYVWHPGLTAWVRAPDRDFSITASLAFRGQMFNDVWWMVAEPGYRVTWVPSAVAVSGGVNVTVSVETSCTLR
jgi:hypothetical protein